MFINIIFQWGRTVFVVIVGFLIPPMMNYYLGTELYGTWQSLVALTGVVQLLALGVPMATVRFISQAIAKKDDNRLQGVLSTCTGIYLTISLVALIVGGGLVYLYSVYYLPQITDFSMRSTAIIAAAIIAVSSSFSFICRFPYSVMAGYRYFVPLNIITVVMVFIKTSLVLCVLIITQSLVYLAIVECIIVAADFFLGYSYLSKKHSGFNLGLAHFDKTLVTAIFGFGGYVLFVNMGTKLSFQIDALVIGRALTLKDVAFYGASNTLLVQLIELMIAMAGVVMPEASKYDAEGRRHEFAPILFKWSKIALSIALLVGLYLIIAGSDFVSVWMHDPSFLTPTQQILPILVISSLLFLPMRAVSLPMLFGFGDVKKPALAFFAAGLLNLIISISLVKPYGLTGVAVGTALPNIFFSIYILHLACRSVDIHIFLWFKLVVLKCLIGGAVSLAFLYGLKQFISVDSFIGIFELGVPFTVVFAVIWIFYVYKNDPYLDLQTIVLNKIGNNKK